MTEEICWGYLGTDIFVSSLANDMASAESLVATMPVEQQRVNYFKHSVYNTLLKGVNDHATILTKQTQTYADTIPESSGGVGEYGGVPQNVNWNEADTLLDPLSGFLGTDVPLASRMEIKMIHDDQWLYIHLLDNVDPSTLQNALPFGLTSYTDPLFYDSFVFTVNDPNASPTMYRQIAVKGAGTTPIIDHMGSGNTSTAWNSGWTGIADNSLAPNQWRCWITIALDQLLPTAGTASNTSFNANFYRYTYGDPSAFGDNDEVMVWKPHFKEEFLRLPEFMVTLTLE